MYMVGLENFMVEVDAKYIKGMINNVDIQPSATINRWIARILLFDFKLRHVSAKDQALADGLSQRQRTSEDSDDDGDTSVRKSGPCNRKKTANRTDLDRFGPDHQLPVAYISD